MLSITSLKYARCTCPTFIALRIVIRCYIVITVCGRYALSTKIFYALIYYISVYLPIIEKKETRKKEKKSELSHCYETLLIHTFADYRVQSVLMLCILLQ